MEHGTGDYLIEESPNIEDNPFYDLLCSKNLLQTETFYGSIIDYYLKFLHIKKCFYRPPLDWRSLKQSSIRGKNSKKFLKAEDRERLLSRQNTFEFFEDILWTEDLYKSFQR